MNNLESIFKKAFLEFLKNVLFCVRGGCLGVTIFIENAYFILLY